MKEILFLIFAYLLGSIPFGLLIGKIFKNSDIRKQGSGNIGATNVTRILGKKLGFLTLLLDSVKGLLIAFMSKKYFSNEILLLSSFLAIIGHIFPVWLRFKGGKGVATSFAIILYLNYYVGICCLLTWFGVFLIFRMSSLSSIISFLLLPIYITIFSKDKLLLFMSLIISVIVILRHKENISRILKKEEKKLN